MARLIRCAIVASGTRNALAISAVVRPPTARSVSAIADDGVSAGWQHMNSRTSVSSSCEVVDLIGRGRDLLVRRRLHHHDVLAPAAGQLRAQVVGHAPGGDLDQPAARVVGDAVARPLLRRREQRLLHRVLGGGEVAEAADHRAEHLRRELAQQVLARVVERRLRHTSTGGALITWRTSIGMFSGTPPVPGAAEARPAIS